MHFIIHSFLALTHLVVVNKYTYFRNSAFIISMFKEKCMIRKRTSFELCSRTLVGCLFCQFPSIPLITLLNYHVISPFSNLSMLPCARFIFRSIILILFSNALDIFYVIYWIIPGIFNIAFSGFRYSQALIFESLPKTTKTTIFICEREIRFPQKVSVFFS